MAPIRPRCVFRNPKSRASRASRRRRAGAAAETASGSTRRGERSLREGVGRRAPVDARRAERETLRQRAEPLERRPRAQPSSARTTLSLEFLSRAAQSIEALDPEAAGIWIDEAEALLGATDEGVRKARSALTEQLIAMESAKPVPASALKIAHLRRAGLFRRAPASAISKAGSTSSSRSAPTARRATS